MAAASNPRNPNFILSPHQQDLLFAALNSNKVSSLDTNTSIDPLAMAPMSFTESPLEHAPGSGTLNGFEDSPFIDYDYDFDGDGSFDYSFDAHAQGQMIGKLPGTSSDGDEVHDKRSHPDDDDEDEDGGGKRREGEEKGSKKPGRKPLTSEPTSKRKAQNRAAQRAFRERKEKHLKDLETKVEDLEKASESANHENSVLRAQIEKMAVELKEYKKRLSLSGSRSSPPLNAGMSSHLGGRGVSNPNDVSFQFEFPKFGKLPGQPTLNGSSIRGSSIVSPPAPVHRTSTSSINSGNSPFDQTLQHTTSLGSFDNGDLFQNNQTFGQSNDNVNNDMSAFSGLWSPSIIENADTAINFNLSGQFGSNASRSSTDSSTGQNSTGHNTNYSSPSASSHVGSNAGLSSSCGTSPEPSTHSPATYKPNDNVLSTIGEENTTNGALEGEATFCDKLAEVCGNIQNPIPRVMSKSFNPGTLQTPGFDLNGIDFWAQQNGNQFDPQLFGDYREPQNNIVNGGLYDEGFFTEAFALPEFNSPLTGEPSPAPKKDLMQEIDAKLHEEDDVYPADNANMLTCNTMWEKIQACPKVQSGEVDMDSLCSELQQKAKCSGDGPVINEKDFTDVIRNVLKPKVPTS